MIAEQVFLFFFLLGLVWAVAALLLGGLHLHVPKFGHFDFTHGHGGAHAAGHGAHQAGGFGLTGLVTNPNCWAVFLAWFGGTGYLLVRHSHWAVLVAILASAVVGLAGSVLLAMFLGWLQSNEVMLDPADYELPGTLARVLSPIRTNGVGEVLYVQSGVRKTVSARSDDNQPIGRDTEVVVTRVEGGIAYVRAWEMVDRYGRE